MTGGIHHVSNYGILSQICQTGLLYYHPEVFSFHSVLKEVGSVFGL